MIFRTFICLPIRNRRYRSAEYVNTTQQQHMLNEVIGHTLDAHNYEKVH